MLPFQQIAQILGDDQASSQQKIMHFAYDSRLHMVDPEATLFVALKTVTNDGHAYIQELIGQGVQHFLISDDTYQVEGAHFIRVEDTLKALQYLASEYRNRSNARFIAITGSNGKTITKDALALICERDGLKIIKSPRSFNSQLGVALSLLQLKEDTEIAIIEAGVSQAGEMKKLAEMIRPHMGICTHLGDAHDSGFESVAEKVREKSILFLTANKVIISASNKYVTMMNKCVGRSTGLYIVSPYWEENSFVVDGEHYNLSVRDEVSLNNLSLAISAAHDLEIYDIGEKLKGWTLPNNRLSLLEGQYNSLIINDSYTSDAQALQAAVHFTKNNAGDRKWVAIVSAFEHEKGGDEIVSLLQEYGAEQIYTVGTGFAKADFADVNQIIEKLNPQDFKNRAVLIKGLRKYQLDKVSHWLEAKKNATQLVINLDVLRSNYERLTGNVELNVQKLVMLKAYAYGSGAGQMARFLKTIQPDYVGVAHADEGVQLRKAGLNLPILVLYTDIQDIETLLAYRLEPVVYSVSYLKELCKFSREAINLHLELDTGMHRLGFGSSDLNKIEPILSNAQHKVVGIMSHLSSADEPHLDTFTQGQIDLFKNWAEQLEQNLGYRVNKHLCNSIGTQRFPKAHFDMVRLGIGLYGFVSEGAEPIGQLQSQIIQIKTIPAGEGIGYGNLESTGVERKIAVIPIGYADGFDRALGNGKWKVIVNKVPCPTVGNICMDMCMIDVTNTHCKESDIAILFGKENTVETMAGVLNTIPYEIVSRISERVKRVYLSE